MFGRTFDLEMLPYGADYFLQTGISLPWIFGQPIPYRIVVGRRDCPSPPGVPAQLYGDLEDDELVGPGGEAAGTAKVVELARHCHQGVAGSLLADVVELDSGHRNQTPPLLALAACGPQQQVVQALDGLHPLVALDAQALHPRTGLGIQRFPGDGRRAGHALPARHCHRQRHRGDLTHRTCGRSSASATTTTAAAPA